MGLGCIGFKHGGLGPEPTGVCAHIYSYTHVYVHPDFCSPISFTWSVCRVYMKIEPSVVGAGML